MQANLGALVAVQPAVAERLCRPVIDEHLLVDGHGALSLRHHTIELALSLSSQERETLLENVERGTPVFLFGGGDPRLLTDLLGAGHRVTLWDRDLAMIRHVFYEVEVHAALRRGALRVAMGVDILDAIERRNELQFVAHPVLESVYRSESLLWETGLPKHLACVCTGGLFIHDVSNALRDQGYGVLPLELLRVSKEEVDYSVSRAAPELVVGINYVKGIEGLAVRQKVPVACWEIDPTTDRILPPTDDTSDFHLFTYREAQVELFEAAGFQHVTYLPLAADVSRRKPRALTGDDRERYAVAVAHVGSSMDAQARRFERAYLQAYTAWGGGTPQAQAEGRRIMESILATQALDPCNYTIDQLMAEQLGEFMADMNARRPELNVTYWLAEMAARDKRLEMMRRLAPHGAHVWGDPGWQTLERDGVVVRGRANHGLELNNIYSSAQIQIDIGRIYQSDIVTMRVFDVLACGGFLLAEWSPALERAFDVGEEIEAWRTPQELEEKVAHYLAHPLEREAIAQAGLHAVRDRHRMRQRVHDIVTSTMSPRVALS